MITKIKIYGYRIYKKFELAPNKKLNLIVGANEAGKSTLIEVLTLALTGRINGRGVAEELNPYWFNTEIVANFVKRRLQGEAAPFPKILIEVYLEDRPELQELLGAVNSDLPVKACPGVSLGIEPNPEYLEDLQAWAKVPSHLLPVEYYRHEWRSFADKQLYARPKQLSTALIDSRTVRSSSGVDHHLRQILGYSLEPAERAAIAVAYRQVKVDMSARLKGVNDRLSEQHTSPHGHPISLAMDQSARSSWEGVVTPHVNDVPFSMSGQGQQAAIKIALAMSRHSTSANFVMVEEPENHLSHTSLAQLISRMGEMIGEEQQVFVTTHSSFVLNRLGLGALLLVGNDSYSKISDLDGETVKYFQKLPGYDTLRIALASKIVLVEGPSDEIVFERFFCDMFGKRPMELGIDVISMRGLSIARCLELCAALGKQVAVLRDNDGHAHDDLRAPVAQWLEDGRRELFIGGLGEGATLEPQLVARNGEAALRKVLGITPAADLSTWMTREKTEGALRIASSKTKLIAPAYMSAAATFIHG
ncbi:ATP-dependent endonuclease [Lysobacter enzymogenes]|uniref:AAA family ATPase n=1 Tax=Lysobacter enzymogenes TaxID=69 RepID=UPI0019D1345C|nr:ATP-dependent endonuclease [Lysobacter enzymogenes]